MLPSTNLSKLALNSSPIIISTESNVAQMIVRHG
jgi:hypothetical protein